MRVKGTADCLQGLHGSHGRWRRPAVLATVILLILGLSAAALAQRRGRGFGGFTGSRMLRGQLPNAPYDGRFTFVRINYDTAPGGFWYRGLPAWAHGFSVSEENLMKIMNEVSYLGANDENFNILALDDPEIREDTKKKTVDLFRLVDRGGCRHKALVGYFDETIEPCGTSCDVCRGIGIADLVAATLPAADVTRSRGTRSGAAAAFEGGPEVRARFERLRALRKRIADSEGVPAYIVFSDATLRHMAEINPSSRTEMALVSGVGPVKLERYGVAFLDLLREG